MTYSFDPDLAGAVPFLPALDLSDVEATRQGLLDLLEKMPAVDYSGLEVRDFQVPVRDGTEALVRVFQPVEEARAGLFHIHGGGFVAGSVGAESGGAATLARQLGITVASVEYRLAPEHPYPAGLDDCMAGLGWFHGQAETLGFDAARVGVFGQSAGGGLAAAVALRARDEGGPPLCFQFLGIPELDDRLKTPSMRRFVDTPMWNRPSAELSWRYYLSSVEGDIPYYAAPSRARDLRGLPPAYVTAMEFDPLRDEAIDYAARLLKAGVTVELHVYPGTFHGSSAIPGAAVSRRIQAEGVYALRRGLGLAPPAAE